MTSPGRPAAETMIPIAVAGLTAVCFLPTLSGSFLNWDDNVTFLDNPAYRGLGVQQIRWAFTSVLFGHCIPLTRLSWSLNYVLGGMDPWGYHLLNLLLHGLNAALFYFVARRLLAAAGNAEGSLRHAIALRPDLPDAYFNLGTALVLQGRYADAESPLRSFIERAPYSASGLERLGLVYLLEGRHHAAIPLLRDALTRNPNAQGLRGYLAQALRARARELDAQGRGTEAAALLAEARGLGAEQATGSSARP